MHLNMSSRWLDARDIIPLLTHWSNIPFAPSHQSVKCHPFLSSCCPCVDDFLSHVFSGCWSPASWQFPLHPEVLFPDVPGQAVRCDIGAYNGHQYAHRAGAAHGGDTRDPATTTTGETRATDADGTAATAAGGKTPPWLSYRNFMFIFL